MTIQKFPLAILSDLAPTLVAASGQHIPTVIGDASPSDTIDLPNPFAIDPQDVTGHASDTGPGTPSHPLRSVAEFNRRVVGRSSTRFTGELLSTVNEGEEEVTLANSAFDGPGGIDWVGTIAVVGHGTLTGGTVAINAATNTSQLIEDTAQNFNDFSSDFIRVTAGARTGNTTFLIEVMGTQAIGGQSYDPSGALATGGMQSGDAYEVFSTPNLACGDLRCGGSSPQPLTFKDITVLAPVNGLCIYPAAVTIQTECVNATPVVVAAGGQLASVNSPLIASPAWYSVGGDSTLTIAGGFIEFPSTGTFRRVFVSGDTFVSETIPVTPIIDNEPGVAELVIGGDSTEGVQFVGVGGIACVFMSGPSDALLQGLVWGSNNSALATVVMAADCTMQTPPGGFVPPTVGGNTFDFILGDLADLPPMARAFDEAAGAYTALIAATWTNYPIATPAGFGFNAHNLTTNTHLTTAIVTPT
jgi:hypothetical protein